MRISTGFLDRGSRIGSTTPGNIVTTTLWTGADGTLQGISIARCAGFVQRGRRGYAQEDLWNFDSYLISVLIPAFKDYNRDNMGWSGEGTFEEYQAEVEKMISGFEAAKKIQDLDFPGSLTEYRLLEADFQNAIEFFTKEFFGFWL